MLYILHIILFLFISCADRDNKVEYEPNKLPESLVEKKKFYCDAGRLHGESVAWNIHACDSLLHASLWGFSCGTIPIDSFMAEPGKWHRKTTLDCLANGESKTTISKDMFRGLFFYLLKHRRLDLVNQTIDYGKKNNWVMGEGESESDPETIARVVLSPGLISELFDLQSILKGTKLMASTESLGFNTGFRAHLDVLGILFRGQIYGGITDAEVDTLKKQSDRQPENTLFQFARHLYETNHNIEGAIALLENEKYFPLDRLPTSADRCVGNLFEHDKKDSDWLPCPDKNETHSGADFVFAVSLLDGTLSEWK